MKTKQSRFPKKLVLFLTLLAIFSISIIIVFFYFKSYQLNQKNKENLVSKSELNIPSDWKTYTNNFYTVKYPPQWEIKTTSWKEDDTQYQLNPDDLAKIRFSEPSQPRQTQHGGFPYGITISFKKPRDNIKKLTARQWADKTISKEINPKIEDIDINGIKTAKVTTIFDGTNTGIFIPYKDKICAIYSNSFTTADSPRDPSYKNVFDYEKIFNQMLSTFHFID